MKKQKIRLYTITAIAKKIGIKVSTARRYLSQGIMKRFQGYKYFGGNGHPYYFYDEALSLEVVKDERKDL